MATSALATTSRADVLVIDGNPLDDIGLLADPDQSVSVIMKNGVLHRNHV